MAKLHIIDFSDGIRSEEIQENFEILNDEISRERLSIGGPGIASGLEITPLVSDSQFAIKISEASIVDKNGDEIYIEEQIVDIERPRLSKQLEYLTADVNNQVQVKEVPYMLNRVCPVQYGDSLAPLYCGINIKYQNSTSTDDYIRVKAVNGKTLTLTGLTRRNVAVEYYSTAKRIDTIYIDTNNKINVKSSSITSTTPSAIIPEKYNYLIAFIQIESEYMADSNDAPHAYITLKKDLRSSRNIYTASDGTLYICGTAFNDLHLISTEEPLEPKPNQLWLDGDTLYVWQAVDSYTYKRTVEITQDRNFDGFNDFETAIDYKVNGKQLRVFLNSIELKSTEYDELFGSLPASIQIIPANTYSDKFRVYTKVNAGDVLTYTITFNESGYRWVPINKESYVNAKEYKVFGRDSIWEDGNYWSSPQALALGTGEDGYPNKYSYFIFNAETDRNMIFAPGRNEVSVMINQMPLHRDQFSEISIEMLPSLPEDIQNAIVDKYKWDEGKLSTMNGLYDDIGIGIMLNEPLDAIAGEYSPGDDGKIIYEDELYVEISVDRAVSSINSTRKLQRSAVYIYEDKITVENDVNPDIAITGDAFYRYNENQLEVYLNGMRLIKDVDYEEGTDLEIPTIDHEYDTEDGPYKEGGYYNKEISGILRLRGSVSRQFTILKSIFPGDVISYRITSNFFSYDHINSIINDLETEQETCSAKVETLYNTTLEFCQNTEAALDDMRKEVARVTGDNIDSMNNYLTTSSIIPEENIDPYLVNRIPQSVDHIYRVIEFGTYSSMGYDLTDCIRREDFVLIWWRDVANGNIDRMLLPDEDYVIIQDTNAIGVTSVYLRLTDTALSNIKTGDRIIIRGIKFGRDGR